MRGPGVISLVPQAEGHAKVRAMDPEQWVRVREVFDRVADSDPSEQAVLLSRLCGEDLELRREVESLFDAASRAEVFLETPLGLAAPGSADSGPPPPERIGPYRVLAEIGSGGMGTVYRAVREDFPKTVALKVVRSSLDGTLLRRRFRHERAILAGLEHPSIARLYDGGTTEDGRPYLVMELVDGLPLLEHAERHGLPAGARVELFLEVCAAVAFAHGRGVVHRDLKPGNVLVDAAGCPKLLDFGVAKLLDPATGEGEPTITIAPLMTPEYASPEQVRGEPVGPASDVYSLGVLLHELLCGRRPYPLASRSAREVEKAVCDTEPVGLPRELGADLDAIVRKALRKDPRQRYLSAEALAADLRRYLDGLPVLARRGTWRYRAGKLLARHRALVAALILGAVALGVGFGLARLAGRGDAGGPGRIPAGRTVAVLGFTNLSGRAEDEWIAAVLTEMLRTELAASEELRPIPAENVALARTDLGLTRLQSFGAATLQALHRRLGADLVVEGSYLAGLGAGAPLRVDVRVQAAPGGERMAGLSDTASVEEILELVARSGFELRSRLGLRALTPTEAQELVASRPAERQAARLYAEGVRAFHTFETARARSLLEAAIARSPEFAPASFQLAEVLMRQGFEGQAVEQLDRAAQLAGSLPRRERLRIAGHRAQWTADWEGAIAAYRELLALAPHDLEAGLALGQAQIAARRLPDALATLAALRQLPPPQVDDPRIDMLEARAARGSAAGYAAAERAVAKAQALSAHLLLARARFAEGAQLWDSPEIAKAILAFEEALRLATAAGDRVQQGGTRIQIGMARWRAGEVAAGEAEVEQVLETVPAAELPSLRRDALDFLGTMLLYRGQLGRARAYHQEAAELARLLATKEAELNHEGWLGTLQHLSGEPAVGRRRLEAAHAGLVGLRAEFYREDLALALGWLLLESGELDAAEKLAQESQPEAPHALHENLWTAESLWLQGAILAGRGELGPARERLEAARQLLDASSMRHQAAEIRLSLAALALEEGEGSRATRLAREAVDCHRPWAELSFLVPSASAILPRALLAAGRLAEARTAFEPLRQAAAASESRLHRLEVEIDGARLQAAAGGLEAAASELRRVVAEAERIGYVATSLRARLALGETLGRLDLPEAERQLSALAAEANRRGFGLIARQATALARRGGEP